jgi:hypothetical protein
VRVPEGHGAVDEGDGGRVTKAAIRKLVQSKRGLLLDISLGGVKQPRSLSLHADLGHSPLVLPFPLPTASVHTAVVMHVLEYLPPAQVFAWFDELWRIMQPHGTVYCSGPYGGDDSLGWLSDPMHQTRILETSFAWLDPRTPLYALHKDLGRPTPKPWHPQAIARQPGTQGSISYNSVMVKHPA